MYRDVLCLSDTGDFTNVPEHGFVLGSPNTEENSHLWLSTLCCVSVSQYRGFWLHPSVHRFVTVFFCTKNSVNNVLNTENCITVFQYMGFR